jgi:hypothetical protein
VVSPLKINRFHVQLINCAGNLRYSEAQGGCLTGCFKRAKRFVGGEVKRSETLVTLKTVRVSGNLFRHEPYGHQSDRGNCEQPFIGDTATKRRGCELSVPPTAMHIS